MEYYTELDIAITPLYFLLILIVAYFIRLKNKDNPLYRFFLPGLIVKLFGALIFCFVYTHYYGYGGDTINYHNTSKSIVNLSYKSFTDFLYVWLGEKTEAHFSLFDDQTGYPAFWSDPSAFNVGRLIVPLEFITYNCFPATSLLTAVLGFTGLWKLYLLFSELYPSLYKHFAFALLFVPSVVFWGSGIMKDTFTASAVCWYCYSFNKIIIQRKTNVFLIGSLTVSVFIMILVKPYAFVALLPGSILWGIFGTIKKVKNILWKIVFGPIVIILGTGLGIAIWMVVSPNLGRYSNLDSMIEKAYESKTDLKQEYYAGNSFDIGDFEKTPLGVLSKFPQATMAGLFRPYIWEANNIQMAVSGLENLFILGFTLFFLIRIPISLFKQIIMNPLVMFCLVFSVMFAFAVGLSTSNFGALVRFKIPLWPFYLSALFVINHHRIKYKVTKISQDIF